MDKVELKVKNMKFKNIWNLIISKFKLCLPNYNWMILSFPDEKNFTL